MSQSYPPQESELPQPDSSDSVIVFVDLPGDAPAEPLPPHVREALKRQVVDSYAVDREKIATVKQLAIHLGRQKADLIREGLDLVLEKYRDQLGDLLDPESPSGNAKPENGPPSP